MLIETKNNVVDNKLILKNNIKLSETTKKISQAFDYDFDGCIKTEIDIPKFPNDFQIGLIVGSSGSGKSTLLKKCFGEEEKIDWNNDLCVADNFENFDDASDKLGAVGLNSIPAWLQSYNTLSNGQKFRADVARRLKNNSVIDEFTSVVNRECAISCSNSIQKYIRNNDLQNIVFCSCHYDIIDWLKPDWIYDTDKKKLSVGRSVRHNEQKIVLEINQCTHEIWYMFEKHHYLNNQINKAADCYILTWNDEIVGFASILSMPGKLTNDKRLRVSEHRIVILPDYQGLGFGNKVSEYLGELYLSQGYRYYAKTANPRMGEHREKSNLWKPTSTNLKTTKNVNDITLDDIQKCMSYSNIGRVTDEKSAILYLSRLCYSHEYIGDENTHIPEEKNFYYKTKNKKRKLF